MLNEILANFSILKKCASSFQILLEQHVDFWEKHRKHIRSAKSTEHVKFNEVLSSFSYDAVEKLFDNSSSINWHQSRQRGTRGAFGSDRIRLKMNT